MKKILIIAALFAASSSVRAESAFDYFGAQSVLHFIEAIMNFGMHTPEATAAAQQDLIKSQQDDMYAQLFKDAPGNVSVTPVVTPPPKPGSVPVRHQVYSRGRR